MVLTGARRLLLLLTLLIVVGGCNTEYCIHIRDNVRDNFCIKCGKKPKPIYSDCYSCNKTIYRNETFCTHCGADQKNKKENKDSKELTKLRNCERDVDALKRTMEEITDGQEIVRCHECKALLRSCDANKEGSYYPMYYCLACKPIVVSSATISSIEYELHYYPD